MKNLLLLTSLLFGLSAFAQPILRNQFTTNASSSGNSKIVRTTAAGVPDAVTIGTGLSFDGTTLSATGTTSSPTNAPIILSLTGGTNVTGGDWSLGSASGTTFKIIANTNLFFTDTSFSNVPTTNGQQNCLLYIINTGTNLVQWTNSVFGFVNGVAPTQTTNGTDVYSLFNSLSTNGTIFVVPMNALHR